MRQCVSYFKIRSYERENQIVRAVMWGRGLAWHLSGRVSGWLVVGGWWCLWLGEWLMGGGELFDFDIGDGNGVREDFVDEHVFLGVAEVGAEDDGRGFADCEEGDCF